MKKIILLILIMNFNLAAMPHDKVDREKILEDLGVTPEQKERIKALRDDHKEDYEKIIKLREEMKSLILDPSVSDSVILDKSKEINSLMLQKHESRIRHLLAMRKILTKEQLVKLLDKMHKKFEERRKFIN